MHVRAARAPRDASSRTVFDYDAEPRRGQADPVDDAPHRSQLLRSARSERLVPSDGGVGRQQTEPGLFVVVTGPTGALTPPNAAPGQHGLLRTNNVTHATQVDPNINFVGANALPEGTQATWTRQRLGCNVNGDMPQFGLGSQDNGVWFDDLRVDVVYTTP
jgi:hypothetical protein